MGAYKEKISKILNNNVFPDIFRWSKIAHKPVLIMSLLNLVVSGCGLMITISTRGIIDGATSHNIDDVKLYAIILVATFLGSRICTIINGILRTKTDALLMRELRVTTLNSLLHKEYRDIETYHSGELMNHMFSDVGIIKDGIITVIPKMISMVVSFIGASIILISMDFRFLILILLGGIIGLLVIAIFKNPMSKRHKAVQKKEDRLHAAIQETVENISLIKASSSEERMVSQVEKSQDDLVEVQLKKGYFSTGMNASLSLVFQFSWLFCMLWGCRGIYTGALTYGALAAIIQLIGQIQNPIKSIADVAGSMYGTISSAERIKAILDLQDEEGLENEELSERVSGKSQEGVSGRISCKGQEGVSGKISGKSQEGVSGRVSGKSQEGVSGKISGKSQEGVSGRGSGKGQEGVSGRISCKGSNKGSCRNGLTGITFDKVDFDYGREHVLKAVDINIKSGDFVALTGISGGGKSTLFKLLLGIYKPNEGEVRIEHAAGSAISGGSSVGGSSVGGSSVGGTGDYELASVVTRKYFAYVPQGNTLFSGTLKENLMMFTDSATDAEIEEAVKVACLDEFVATLINGYDTIIGERGIGLSEGQAQRVAVARAILTKAPVLLLDESTSALDEETEAKLLNNISNLQGKTCIIVTHRKAALSICDYRLHVENGHVSRERC